MLKKHSIFKVMGTAIALLTTILIAINVLYIKTFCSGRQCFVVNVSTIFLLIWAIAFLFIVLKHSGKNK